MKDQIYISVPKATYDLQNELYKNLVKELEGIKEAMKKDSKYIIVSSKYDILRDLELLSNNDYFKLRCCSDFIAPSFELTTYDDFLKFTYCIVEDRLKEVQYLLDKKDKKDKKWSWKSVFNKINNKN